MKYDFSGISTEKLKMACNEFTHIESACEGITCGTCPFDNNCSGYGITYKGKKYNKEFKAELERRENMNNEMPELKAGMIVEVGNGEWKLLLPDLVDKELFAYNRQLTDGARISNIEIINIYMHQSGQHYYSILEEKNINEVKLIWSKKSENDIHIEVIEKTIKDMEEKHAKSIEDLKNQVKELKS